MIQDQVKLPLSVSFSVVMQGIRIRFGRSLVTIMGVVLGIAFLVSILVGQVIKSGVAQEDAFRIETKRMFSFLTGEMGPARDRTIGLIEAGPLGETEGRLLARLGEDGLKTIQWAPEAHGFAVPAAGKATVQRVAGVPEAVAGASIVLVMGDGSLSEERWAAVREATGKTGICVTRNTIVPAAMAASVVSLAREMSVEEKQKAAVEAGKSQFRNLWIIVISLLVTVIGIANAMLMSVTERFREIGTMKCLGALSRFVRQIFIIEATIMGLVGAFVGCLLGTAFTLVMYGAWIYGFGLVLHSLNIGQILLYLGLAQVAGVILSVIAAIYPASVASSMVPADALRSNI
jgi:hypothetical protein